MYRLNNIYFYLTEGCNLRCRHCWIVPSRQTGPGMGQVLDFDLFCSIIKQALSLGLSAVKLTGGEPFLHPRIVDIIDHAEKSGLHITIETNGVLCAPDMAKRLAACKNISVAVSLDGTSPAIHDRIRGVAGSFESAKRGLFNLIEAGLRPQIVMTVMRDNHGQVEGVARFAKSCGASSVKFNIVQPTGRGELMREENETLTIEELVSLGEFVEGHLSASSTIPLLFSHPPAFRSLGKLYSGTDGCGTCGILGILGVLSSGHYALCGIGETISELVFGDAGTDRLEDIWNNNSVLQELRSALPGRLEGVCGDCILKSRCLGSCIAQNYYRAKSLLAGFWYCEEAAARGLFPDNRRKSKLKDRVCINSRKGA